METTFVDVPPCIKDSSADFLLGLLFHDIWFPFHITLDRGHHMSSPPLKLSKATRSTSSEEAALGGGKMKQPKKIGAAQGKNRRVLGDIGNLVPAQLPVEGKPSQQISRPITRSFCAQLLENAQAAAVAENNKKLACVNLNGGDKAVGAEKRAKEKTKELADKDLENKKKADKSARRKVPTLTSVLPARSKAACGLSRRPEGIVDIDVADAGDELAVSVYVEDLYLFYKEAENECRLRDYMLSQPEINEKMRAILVDWLIEIHHKFELMPETLYLTINIIDRFLSAEVVPRKELQLLGMGAMFTASKYEEIWAPEVNDFACIADRAYTNTQVLVMEKTILGKLEWYLTVPTHYVFLARFIKASLRDDKLKHMVHFLAELGLMNYAVTIRNSPSMVAASAVYAARCSLNVAPLWNKTLEFHTGYSEAQLMGCARSLASLHTKAKDEKLQGVYKKYSKSEREAVALIPPARCHDRLTFVA
ncbi:hypothetical protein MLD38_012704 [Melastoma candidum]|uniref:Uncharacterized protein n=1 Tax=Melastoma candidum TaxID=119954 RepID=A0ACB9R7A2_9MYRT|nr:hypothetical protein MLD38_012704 [Melastoma candidum]